MQYTRADGTTGRRVRPYIIDLASGNGTYLNNQRIEPQRYYELKEKDVLKFGFSSREYVLLHEFSDTSEVEAKQEEEEEDEDEGVDADAWFTNTHLVWRRSRMLRLFSAGKMIMIIKRIWLANFVNAVVKEFLLKPAKTLKVDPYSQVCEMHDAASHRQMDTSKVTNIFLDQTTKYNIVSCLQPLITLW